MSRNKKHPSAKRRNYTRDVRIKLHKCTALISTINSDSSPNSVNLDRHIRIRLLVERNKWKLTMLTNAELRTETVAACFLSSISFIHSHWAFCIYLYDGHQNLQFCPSTVSVQR